MNEQNLGMLIDLLEEVKQGNINSHREQKMIAERIEAIETVIERGLDLSDDVKKALANRNELTTKQLNAIAKALLQTMAEGFDGLKANTKTEDRPCYYFFDRKSWAKWVGLALTLTMFCSSLGLYVFSFQQLRMADKTDFSYRYCLMKGYIKQKGLDEIKSILADENKVDSLRIEISQYEDNLRREAELLLRQKQIDEEREALKKQFKQ